MRSILIEKDREALAARVASLTPGSSARWGLLTVDRMLAHLCQSARMALGELPVRSRGKRAFQVFPLKHLILYVFPFPKGAPTAPELLAGPPAPVEDEQRALLDLLARLGSGPREGARAPLTPSSAPCRGRSGAPSVYKHSDHHLRQFGA